MTDINEMSAESVSQMSQEDAQNTINQLKSDAVFREKMTGSNLFGQTNHAQGIWDALHVQASGQNSKEYAASQEQPPTSEELTMDDRVPSSPSGYHIATLSNLPMISEILSDSPQAQAQLDKDVRTWAHAMGASSLEINGLLRVTEAFLKSGLFSSPERLDKLSETADMRLRAEWGPDAEKNMMRTNRFLREKVGESFMKFMDETGIDQSEIVMRKMFELAQKAGY